MSCEIPLAHEEDYRGHRIEIHYDTDTPNPKKDYDGMCGTFVTWHRDYVFDVDGTQEYPNGPEELFAELAGINIDDLDVRANPNYKLVYVPETNIAKVVDGFRTWRHQKDGRQVAFEYEYKYKNRWYGEDEIREIIREEVDKRYVILPVSMLDHSGITLYEGSSSHWCDPGGWDSGPVGFIYAPKSKYIEETGYSKDDLFSTDRHRTPKAGDHVRIQGVEYDRWAWGKVKRVEGGAFLITHQGLGDKYPQQTFRSVLSEIVECKTEGALRDLRGELAQWNDYVTGNVFGYVIHTLDEDGDSLDDWVESCWGFWPDHPELDTASVRLRGYEPDYEYCLREARDAVDYLVKSERKSHFESVKTWIKNKVPLYARTPLEI